MTPWGEPHMPNANYLDDFSTATGKKINFLHHFIHEMAHIWQYQRKNKLLRGSIVICGAHLSISTGIANAIETFSDKFTGGLSDTIKDISGEIDPYTYKNKMPSSLFNYNMESQAEILADYFISEIIGISGYVGKNSNRRIKQSFFLKEVLSDFFEEIEKSARRPRNLLDQWSIK